MIGLSDKYSIHKAIDRVWQFDKNWHFREYSCYFICSLSLIVCPDKCRTQLTQAFFFTIIERFTNWNRNSPTTSSIRSLLRTPENQLLNYICMYTGVSRCQRSRIYWVERGFSWISVITWDTNLTIIVIHRSRITGMAMNMHSYTALNLPDR